MFEYKQIFRTTVLVTVILSAFFPCQKAHAEQREVGDRPNFIIIFTDDQGYNDLGCFGSPNISTPNIDKMAEEGMIFTDFYVACSVCSPSRAALMTGCYPKRVGYPGTINWPKGSSSDTETGLHPNEITIAELLKTKDYHTACIGKWHLGDYEQFLPTRQGFDYYYGIPYSNDMTDPPLPLMRNEEVIEQPVDNALLTQKMTQEAVQYIRDHNDVPFFLYLPHPAPHHPPPVSPDFQGTSAGGVYGDCIEELDWSTGEILKTIREFELENNTCIVYTSDNGPWIYPGKIGGSAYPLRGAKSSAYEGGLRVPCVMWWPGTIPAGTVCSEIATTMDFYVTFPTMLGIELPQDRVIDGKNILPLMLGEEDATSPYDYFLCYGEYLYTGSKAQAIRHGNWKYFYGTGRSSQLYDLSKDVGESTNVALYNGALCESLKAKLLELDNEVETNSRPIGKLSELPQQTGEKLKLENAGFENGDLDSWTVEPFDSQSSASVATEYVRSGMYSLKMSGTSVNVSQTVTGVSGIDYLLTGYAYVSSDNPLVDGQSAAIELSLCDNEFNVLTKSLSLSVTASSIMNEWNKLSAVATVPANSAYIGATIVWNGSDGDPFVGAVFFDDINMEIYDPNVSADTAYHQFVEEQGTSVYMEPDFNDQNWPLIDLLGDTGDVLFDNRTYWFRKTINVPDELAADTSFSLKLGTIDGAWAIWFNGALIHESGFQEYTRKYIKEYDVDDSLIRNGENVIVIHSGFLKDATFFEDTTIEDTVLMQLHSDTNPDNYLSIAGDWLYRQGIVFLDENIINEE
jgi:arylsulfatase A